MRVFFDTVFASSEAAGGIYGAENVNDSNNATAWYAGELAPQWINGQYNIATKIIYYYLQHNPIWYNTRPKSWELLARNSPSDPWDVIDVRTDTSTWNNGMSPMYVISYPQLYNEYRLSITETMGVDRPRIEEWLLYSETYSGNPGYSEDSFTFRLSEIVDAPDNLLASTNQVSQVSLVWDAVTNADYYKIYRDDIFLDSTTLLSYNDTTASFPTVTNFTVSVVGRDTEKQRIKINYRIDRVLHKYNVTTVKGLSESEFSLNAYGSIIPILSDIKLYESAGDEDSNYSEVTMQLSEVITSENTNEYETMEVIYDYYGGETYPSGRYYKIELIQNPILATSTPFRSYLSNYPLELRRADVSYTFESEDLNNLTTGEYLIPVMLPFEYVGIDNYFELVINNNNRVIISNIEFDISRRERI